MLIVGVRISSLGDALLCFENFRHRPRGFTEIALRGMPQPVRLRNATSDFDVFRQVFLQRQYAVARLSRARYVVDAGANVGLTSLYILTRNPKTQIIAIEPDSENFEIAAHNLAPFADRCHLVHAALWSSEESLGVSRGTFCDGRHWATQVVEDSTRCQETVSACTLQSLLRRFQFPRIDLLKIDIEGAELNVFRDGDTSFLADTEFCAVECHSNECEEAFTTAAIKHGLKVSHIGELTLANR